MLELSVSDINKTAPYPVISTGVGSVRFITGKALVYEAGFTPDYTFLEEGCYQFYLKEITGSSASRDVKIMGTVAAIIEEFFAKNQSVALYICDNSDGKQAVRDRIFTGWYDSYVNRDKYTMLHVEAKFDGVAYYTSVIISNSNPDLQDVIAAFNDFKKFVSDKYPDAVLQ